VNATLELTLRPQSEDRKKVVATALRETINILQVSPGIILCPDLLKLIEELDAL